jgi:kynurenine formamidase
MLLRAGLRDRLLANRAARHPGLPADRRGACVEWERQHGRISAGSMGVDAHRLVEAQLIPWPIRTIDAAKASTRQAPTWPTVRFLVDERDVIGFGTETIGTDAGQAAHLTPPYPCHTYMHGAGKYGLQCLANLDQLPPTGAVIIAAPLKIEQGSGSPLRVLALVSKEV